MGGVFLLAYSLEDDRLRWMTRVPDELLDGHWSRHSPDSQIVRQAVRNSSGAPAKANVPGEAPIPPRLLRILAAKPEPQKPGVMM